MDKHIKWEKNNLPKSEIKNCADILSIEEVTKAKKFHESFPEYTETPLVNLDKLAKNLGLGGLYLKDESYRFGLNAFKVL
ncbi:MAG: diaminopropionate ammonia-lyase, partial [Fusobacteriaceae bacterium]